MPTIGTISQGGRHRNLEKEAHTYITFGYSIGGKELDGSMTRSIGKKFWGMGGGRETLYKQPH